MAGRPKGSTNKKKKNEEDKKITCLCCGKEKNEKEFYNSSSLLYKKIGKIPTCKDCIGNIYENYKIKYNNDERLAIYHMCRILDISFNQSCFDQSVRQFNTSKTNYTALWKVYFQKINSIGKNNGYGESFDDSDELDISKAIIESAKTSEEIKSMWGEGLLDSEYKYLNDEYEKLKKNYTTSKDSYTQEILFQDIAFQRLTIRKKRLKGDSVEKELKTLQDLLGSANIKPAQEDANLNNETLTIGTLIKKFENERPIYDPVSDWKSKDWIRKYVCVWFFGNMCKLMGKKNPYEKEYNEEISKYTVTPSANKEDGDEIE